jgi:hypothetical protein
VALFRSPILALHQFSEEKLVRQAAEPTLNRHVEKTNVTDDVELIGCVE